MDAMDTPNPTPISPLLDDMTCELIGLCLDEIADGGSPAPTIAFACSDEDITFFSFDDDGPEAALEAARGAIRERADEIVAYAIAYDGFVNTGGDGLTQDALLVEFGERGLPTAYSAYVAYRRGRTPDDLVVSEPLAAGEEPLLLRACADGHNG